MRRIAEHINTIQVTFINGALCSSNLPIEPSTECDSCCTGCSLLSTQVFSATGSKVDYKVGTMIEVPRGALRAGDLAKTAEFFSFGTNDLTQMTFGISRDDAQVIVMMCYLVLDFSVAGRLLEPICISSFKMAVHQLECSLPTPRQCSI